ncbi:DUF945 family protein [Thiotrichales bacterium HSG1]|nr:DUF945 family protein [Thiotrichales bacterium HSG1]
MRLLFILSILILTSIIPIIPYWTGIEVEQQLTEINKKLHQTKQLILLQSDYQRGWFYSDASSIIRVDKQNYKVKHEINHGFIPIIQTSVQTIIQIKDQVLLEILTKIEINGDNISVLNIPESAIGSYRWHNLQGTISADRQFNEIETTFNSPLLSNGQLDAQNISFQISVNNGIGNGTVEIENLVGAGLQLQAIKLYGLGQIQNDNLMLNLRTKVQKVGNYGSSTSSIKLSNWHLPSLWQLVSTYGEDMMLNQMVQGMELLEHSPKLAVNDFELNTEKGLIHGNLQVKMQPLENPLLVLLNPNPLNFFNLQLEAYVPKPFISTSSTIWQDILMEHDSNYYQTQMVVNNGLLQINGKQLSLTEILQ